LPSKTTYGLAAATVAVLIITGSISALYYTEYQQSDQAKSTYISELSSETSRYDSLAAQYNGSLSLDNQTLALLVGTISVVNTSLPIYQQASTQLSQLWAAYLALKPAPASIFTTNVLVEFGNGTKVWHNDTDVQPGWNAYTLTVLVTRGDMQAQWYPQYQEHLILGLQGVSETATKSWFLWTFNSTALWQSPSVGADDLLVYQGSVFAWMYCPQTTDYAPECTP